jgi:hypothetical protein
MNKETPTLGFRPAETEGPRLAMSPASPSSMTQRFDFADAWWFRIPLRITVLVVTVFTLLSLEPALVDEASPDRWRALAGVGVLAIFLVGTAVFIAALGDSYIEVEERVVRVRFESFFGADFPLDDVARVAAIDPTPRWRYRWGLSTNFRDRVACSHGGQLVEIELERPCIVKLWPRSVPVTKFWLATTDHLALIEALRGDPAVETAPLHVAA